MNPFTKIDEIFYKLHEKQWGKVTAEHINESLKDLEKTIPENDWETKNRFTFLDTYMDHARSGRWHRVTPGLSEAQQKLVKIKLVYTQKTGVRYDDEPYRSKQNQSSSNSPVNFNDPVTSTNNQTEHSKTETFYRNNPETKDTKNKDDHKKINSLEPMTLEQRSREASHQMVMGNPNIVNLSDTNRPTKLADRYSELYDNDWTDAFVYITEQHGQDDHKAIKILLQIILTAYDHCSKEADKDVKFVAALFEDVLRNGIRNVDMKKVQEREPSANTDVSFLKQHRKNIARIAEERVVEEFVPQLYKIMGQYRLQQYDFRGTAVTKYTNKCVQLCWWMCVQDPPVHMCMPKIIHGEPFSSALYRPYTKTGPTMDFLVWPALLLHKDGPVLLKGVVQYK